MWDHQLLLSFSHILSLQGKASSSTAQYTHTQTQAYSIAITNIFTLLIPLLTLLAEVSNAEDVSDFKNPINVTFTVPDSGTTGPEWSWKDRTKYEPFDKKYDESGGFQNVSGDLVAYMLFARPNDKDTARLFDWTTDKGDPAMKSVSLTLVCI